MKPIIIIATSPLRDHWVSQCIQSIRDIPYLVVCEEGFELGKIRWVFENTTLERFFFLQDSCVVKNSEFINLAFNYPGSVAVSNCPVKMGMYLGIYTRQTLSQISIPYVRDKEEAIRYEVTWSNQYCSIEPDIPTLFPEFNDQNARKIENRFGRQNLVLENEYLIKYKGTWR